MIPHTMSQLRSSATTLRLHALVFATLVFWTSATSTGQAAPVSWRELRSDAGRFIVSVPAAPTERHGANTDSSLVVARFSVEVAGRTYYLTFADYSPEDVRATRAGRMLNEDRDAFARGIGGEVRKESPYRCGAHPGRRFEVTSATGQWHRVQLCYASPRMYLLYAKASESKGTDVDGPRFLDSFRILPDA